MIKNGNIYHLNNKGLLHRENNCAIEWLNGTKFWYLNGKQHRVGGEPAIVHKNGHKCWYKHNDRHRADGPAIIYPNGKKKYFLHNFQISKHEFNLWILRIQKCI